MYSTHNVEVVSLYWWPIRLSRKIVRILGNSADNFLSRRGCWMWDMLTTTRCSALICLVRSHPTSSQNETFLHSVRMKSSPGNNFQHDYKYSTEFLIHSEGISSATKLEPHRLFQPSNVQKKKTGSRELLKSCRSRKLWLLYSFQKYTTIDSHLPNMFYRMLHLKCNLKPLKPNGNYMYQPF
jgi:hypothetical protein